MGSRNYGKTAFIFDGGGFKEIGQVGACRAIAQRVIKPDYAQVVSVGAANGIKLMEGGFTESSVDDLEKIWMTINEKGPSKIFRKRDMFGIPWHRSYSFKNIGLRGLLEGLDMKKIIESPVEFRVATRNISRMYEHTLFSNHDECFRKNPEVFRDALLASMSVMGLFPPVNILGESHGDGLTYSIADAIRAGCDTIFILTLSHSKIVAHPEMEPCWRQVMVPFNIVLDELNKKLLREDLSDCIDKNPDFKILDVSSATPQSLWNKFAHGLTSFFASVLRFDNPSSVPHLIIPILLEVPPTIHTLHFIKGSPDFKIAIKKAYDQTNKILDLLEK